MHLNVFLRVDALFLHPTRDILAQDVLKKK